MKSLVQAGLWPLLCLLASGCRGPEVDVTPAVENGRPVFMLSTRGINGLLGFSVLEGTNKLWQVWTSYEKGTKIVYGELPTQGNEPAKQFFPPEGVAPVDISGKTVTVEVVYQYNTVFSACAGTFTKSLRIAGAQPDAEPLENRASSAADPGP